MPSTTEQTDSQHHSGWTQPQQGWGPPRRSSHAKRPMNRNNSNSDFFFGPVGSFAGDSPPGRRPAQTSLPHQPAHEVHYPSHAPIPSPFHPQQPYQDMYHHPQHAMYPPPPPPPYPYGYSNQYAYPPQSMPIPLSSKPPPTSGEGWHEPPGSTPPNDAPHEGFGRPTPDNKSLESPHLDRNGTMSFDANLDDSDSLVGRLSPLGSDFMGKFDVAEPVHVERFRIGFPSNPQIDRINRMMHQAPLPATQQHIPGPPPPPPRRNPSRRSSPPVIPTPPRSTKKKGGGCNCKKTKCLKLYCECFASKKYCLSGCKCSDCHNNQEHSVQRDEAIQLILGRNQSAFETTDGIVCKCKRSACLKKYCECFGSGTICGKKCKCTNCENRAGSQTLIDKRRKMNDQTGAKYAMELAASVWEKPKPKPPPLPKRPLYAASPSQNIIPPRPHQHSYPPVYYQGSVQFPSPGFAPHLLAPQHHMSHQTPLPLQSTQNPSVAKRPAQEITPGTPQSRAMKRRSTVWPTQTMLHLFGGHAIPKQSFSRVLGFLAEGDKKTASQVSKQWNAAINDTLIAS